MLTRTLLNVTYAVWGTIPSPKNTNYGVESYRSWVFYSKICSDSTLQISPTQSIQYNSTLICRGLISSISKEQAQYYICARELAQSIRQECRSCSLTHRGL